MGAAEYSHRHCKKYKKMSGWVQKFPFTGCDGAGGLEKSWQARRLVSLILQGFQGETKMRRKIFIMACAALTLGGLSFAALPTASASWGFGFRSSNYGHRGHGHQNYGYGNYSRRGYYGGSQYRSGYGHGYSRRSPNYGHGYRSYSRYGGYGHSQRGYNSGYRSHHGHH